MPHPTPAPARSTRQPDPRQQGSILVLAVVLIVLLVMMGASFLSMARSDRRSTQQMDTRTNDYNDNELNWVLRTWLVPDLPTQTPTVSATEQGENGIDYPFTWSGTGNVNTGNPALPGDIRQDIQGGRWHTFPIEEGALARQVPLNATANGLVILDPRDATGNARLYRAAGIGPGRSAFLGEISEALGYPFTGNNATVDRGENDDMWLASSEPVFVANLPNGDPLVNYTVAGLGNGTVQGYWPHISNLRGVFVDLDDIQANGFPATYLSTADNNVNSGDSWLDLGVMQQNLENNANGGRFADADGDGIADSRWTYAAATSGGGLTYVAAFRIVDNSALVNVNVATRSGAASNNPGERNRWYNPADLALTGSFTQLAGLSGGNGNATLNALMAVGNGNTGVRGLNNPNAVFPGSTANVNHYIERLTSWVLTGQRYNNASRVWPDDDDWNLLGSGMQKLAELAPASYPAAAGILTEADNVQDAAEQIDQNVGTLGLGGTSEIELRHRNGLNRSQDGDRNYPDAPIEDLTARDYWRADAAIANVEDDFKELYPLPVTRPSIQEFIEEETRKRFTTVNGSGDFLRTNLNQANRTEVREFIEEIGDQIQDAGGSRNGFDLLLPENADLPTWNAFARVAAAFVEDWRDTDRLNTPAGPETGLDAIPELTESLGTGGVDYYGMEYLPFISEVYLKATYDNDPAALQTDVTLSDGTTSGDIVTWDARGGTDYQLIVELVNPWNRPIPIANVELELQNLTTDAPVASFGNLRTAIIASLGTTTAGARDYLRPHEMVTLHFGSFTNADELGEMSTLVPADTEAGRVDLSVAPLNAPAWPVATGGNTWDLTTGLGLALRAPIENPGAGNNTITYQQFAVPFIPPTIVTQYRPAAAGALTLAANTPVASARVSIKGTASGISALAVRPADLRVQTIFDDPASNLVAEYFDGSGTLPTPTSDANPILAVVDLPNATNIPTGITSGVQLGTFSKGQLSAATNVNLDTRVTDARVVTGTGGTATAPANLTAEPFLIGNAGQFFRATDFFRIVFLGPRVDAGNTLTVADVWEASATANAGTYAIQQFMIDAAPPAGAGDFIGTGSITAQADLPPILQQTYPAYLLQHLSTFAPNNDGLDNDGDGDPDDPDEQLVPGRMNLNTINISKVLDIGGNGNEDTLTRVLPMADPAARRGLARALRDARDRDNLVVPTTNRRVSQRTLEEHGYGLQSVAELLDFSLGGIADFSDPALGPLVTNDFNEYEPDLDASTLAQIARDADGVEDDIEERLAIIGALNQTFDVRSDVYTVYIRLRGYETGNFAAGAQRDFFVTATVDRSVVHAGRPVAKILSYSRFDDR